LLLTYFTVIPKPVF